LIYQVEKLFKDSDREGVRIMAEIIGERPAGEIPADHPLVQLALTCTREQGLDTFLTIGSTDANIPLSLGIPSVVMGVSTGGGAHTLHEYIDNDPVDQGMESLVRFVERVGEK
jgi:acetylornithine deacetylase/succinyl-diaminopimelate desuccinylase-like protein